MADLGSRMPPQFVALGDRVLFEGSDFDSVDLAASGEAHLHVIKATYGGNRPARDVTGLVRAEVSGQRLQISSLNSTIGDPEPFVNKRFVALVEGAASRRLVCDGDETVALATSAGTLLHVVNATYGGTPVTTEIQQLASLNRLNAPSGMRTAINAVNSALATQPGTFVLLYAIEPVTQTRVMRLGSNTQIDIPASGLPSGTQPYTIEAWIKTDDMGGPGPSARWIIAWGDYSTTSGSNGIALVGSGIQNFWWNDDLDAPVASLVGRWHHVAATGDGTTRRLFLNGREIASDTTSPHDARAQGFRIGEATNNYAGLIAQVRVWRRALSPREIDVRRFSSVSQGPELVGSWHLDEAATGDGAMIQNSLVGFPPGQDGTVSGTGASSVLVVDAPWQTQDVIALKP